MSEECVPPRGSFLCHDFPNSPMSDTCNYISFRYTIIMPYLYCTQFISYLLAKVLYTAVCNYVQTHKQTLTQNSNNHKLQCKTL